MSNPSLAEVCETLGLLTPEQSTSIRLRTNGDNDRAFANTAMTFGYLQEEGLARALATQFRLNMVPTDRLQKLKVAPEVLDLLPGEMMRKHLIVPTFLDAEKGVLSVLTADPTDIEALRAAQAASNSARLRLFVAPKSAIRMLLDRLSPEEREVTDPGPIRSVALTLAWEPDLERATLLRQLADRESANVMVATTPEEAEKCLLEGNVVRLLHRQELQIPSLQRERWRRAAPAVLVGTVPSWGPGSRMVVPYEQARELLFGILDFVLMISERQRLEVKTRSRRQFVLARQMGAELDLPLEMRDAVSVVALLMELDDPSLLSTPLDPALEGKRFGIALAVLQPLRAPPDLERLLDALDRRLGGNEGPGANPAVELLYTVRAAVRLGLEGGQDPVQRLGTEAARHDAAALKALSQILRRESQKAPLQASPLILIGEREAALVTALESRLSTVGYQVHTLADGEQVLALARSRPVAAIIANFRLPRKDGLSILMELRREPSTATIPVFLLSDTGSASDLSRGFELGAEEVMGRPFHLDLLVSKLRRTLDRNSASRAGISGRISDLPMVDLLQTLTMGGRTAHVRIVTSTENGVLQIRNGKLVSADLGPSWEGEEALYALVDLDEGLFEVHFSDLGRQNIHRPTEFLLLEAVRRRDERRG